MSISRVLAEGVMDSKGHSSAGFKTKDQACETGIWILEKKRVEDANLLSSVTG